MIKNLLLCFAALFLIPEITFSQIKLEGKIQDKQQAPLAYNNIFLKKLDSPVEKQTLSNETGVFTFTVDTGIYMLRIMHLKDTLYYKQVSLLTNVDLGAISLLIKTKELKEVQVTFKRPLIERKIDRLVFNLDQSIASSGGDALDALRITPGVQLQDDQLNIVGKSGALIMINERLVQLKGEALTSFLASIKSDDIKTIEVITNPSARYDAQGGAGLINIVLKKSLPESWNASVQSSYTKNTYSLRNYGASFNLKKSKTALSLGASYNDGSRKRTENDEIYYTDQYWNTNFVKRIYAKSLGLRTGLDYQFSRNVSMGFEYIGNYSRPDVDENDLGKVYNPSNAIDSLIETVAASNRKLNSTSINYHTDIKLDTLGRAFHLNADYLNYEGDIERGFNNRTFLGEDRNHTLNSLSTLNIGQQNVKNYSGKVDFDWPTKVMNFSFGSKVSAIKTTNSLQFFEITNSGGQNLNVEQSNDFIYRENTQALYFSASKNWGKKWSSQIGVRFENTQIEGDSKTYSQVDKNNYHQFFPTLYLVYKADQENILSFDFGRRIQRPGFSSLNPFRFYSSPYNYTEGNPKLKPQFTNTISLRHGYKDKFFTTLSYMKENDGFGQVPVVDDATKNQFLTQSNYYEYNKYTLSFSYVFDNFSWWVNDTEAFGYYNKSTFDANINLLPTSGWGGYLSTINTFNLDKASKYKAGFQFWYQTASPDLLYHNDAYYSLNFFVRCAFAQKKLLLSLQSQDVLRSYKISKNTSTNNIYQVYSSYNDSRSFKVALSYSFGNNKMKTGKSKSSNQEEKGRTD